MYVSVFENKLLKSHARCGYRNAHFPIQNMFNACKYTKYVDTAFEKYSIWYVEGTSYLYANSVIYELHVCSFYLYK